MIFNFILNLIINGLPSIQMEVLRAINDILQPVLNLIINGLPSILDKVDKDENILFERF